MTVEEHRKHAIRTLRVAIITASDTRNAKTDESGALLRKLLENGGHRVAWHRVVRDDRIAITDVLQTALSSEVDVVILNGGTGISPRDVTIEVVLPMLDKELPGFGELLRRWSADEIGSAAMLTRATAGIARGKPVFAIPGSPAAVRLAMERLILPELGHIASEAIKGTGKPGDPLGRRNAGTH